MQKHKYMHKFFTKQFYISLFTMAVLIFFKAIAFAQDSASSSSATSSTTTTQQGTTIPSWVWVVGAVVLLLIIIALVRGSGSKDKTVITKETTRE
ncbi:MAG: hypothetical protein M3Z26_16455 [Bacteroidota bacterium]|nr:hypothetical protein [Bacteroidota bacterium]